MNKPLIIGAAVLVILLTGFVAVRNVWKGNSVSATQAEAIQQAQEYRSTGVCPTVLVDAFHPATGATYTFSNGCLPPDWEPIR